MAAKKAFKGYMSSKWVSMGHSQSGGAVWKLSDHPLVQGSRSEYMGGVAIAPGATKVHEQIESAIEEAQSPRSPGAFQVLQNLPAMIIGIMRASLTIPLHVYPKK